MFLSALSSVFRGIGSVIGKSSGIMGKAFRAGLKGASDLLELEKAKITCTIMVTLDERTCKICRPMQGKKVTLPNNYSLKNVQKEVSNIIGLIAAGGSPLWGELPKFHPNCRCNVDIALSKTTTLFG